MFAYPDCVISSAVIYADWPEYHEIRFIRSRLQADDVIIDVGANIGHLLLLLADIVGPENLHGFEPTPVTFARLRENWRLNSWGVGCLNQLAVGATASKMFIANTTRPVPTNSVQFGLVRSDDVAIEVRPLDAMIEFWRGRRIGLLKVDVEGFEKEVFAGAKSFLAGLRPRLIMFESLDKKIDTVVAESLAAACYRVFQLDGQGRPDFAGDSAQNLFAVPNELEAELIAEKTM